MGSVYERTNKSGKKVYRAVIRRVGIPTYCATFDSEEEARDWLAHNELKYCFDKSVEYDFLMERRFREFKEQGRLDG